MGLEFLKAAGPMIGAVGGPTLSALFTPEGQELSSFEGRGALDPVTMLTNVNTILGRVGKGVTERAATPISLPSSYVQTPPVFSGGGLPMPIGVSGQDPALANPSLLNLQGMGQFQDLFTGIASPHGSTDDDGGNVIRGQGFIQDPNLPPSDRTAVPKSSASRLSESVTRRKASASLVRGADLMDEGAELDDIGRAEAAIRLLMDNL